MNYNNILIFTLYFASFQLYIILHHIYYYYYLLVATFSFLKCHSYLLMVINIFHIINNLQNHFQVLNKFKWKLDLNYFLLFHQQEMLCYLKHFHHLQNIF